MKDILIFCPSIEYGGVEKNLFIIKNYISKKINVSIITANNNHKKKFSKKINFFTPEKNFNNASRFIKNIISIILFFKNFKKKDVIILSFQANITAIILAKIFKKKIIIRSNTSPEKFAQNFWKKYIFKFFFKYADVIVVNSINFKKQIKTFFNLNSICIYNSLENKIIKKQKNVFFKKRTLKIISIGRLTDQKDHLTLIKAFRIVSEKIDSRLMIIGRGEKLNQLKNYVREYDLKNKVNFFGYSNNPEALLKNADLFILTSKYEGLPNVLIEAQNLNIPIISSNCPTGPSEILLSGKLGQLFTVGDYQALSKKIVEFNNNKKKFLKKSKLAKKFLNRFNPIKNCSKYLDIIMKLSNAQKT